MKNSKEDVLGEILMGFPVTLKPEDTLDLANDVISLGRIRHIPVVEAGRLIGRDEKEGAGALVGLATASDIFRYVEGLG
jgi:CBS domain-containing protein